MYHVVYTIYIKCNAHGEEGKATYIGKPMATLEEAQAALSELVEWNMRIPGATKSEEFSAVTVYQEDGDQTEFVIAES